MTSVQKNGRNVTPWAEGPSIGGRLHNNFFSYCFSSPSFNPVRPRRVPCEVPKILTYPLPSNLHADENIDTSRAGTVAEYFSQEDFRVSQDAKCKRRLSEMQTIRDVVSEFGARRPNFSASTCVTMYSIKRYYPTTMQVSKVQKKIRMDRK